MVRTISDLSGQPVLSCLAAGQGCSTAKLLHVCFANDAFHPMSASMAHLVVYLCPPLQEPQPPVA